MRITMRRVYIFISLLSFKVLIYRVVFSEVMGMEGHPLALHEVMFIPALVAQASDEQHKKWLGRAKRREIIGCYAQTEMGHGKNM